MSGFVCFEGKAGECIMGRTDVSAEVGTVEEICRMIDLVSDTMDDYLYICDFQNDFYYISPQAKNRFLLPDNAFHEVMKTHEQFVYPDDIMGLEKEFEILTRGERTTHNRMYRWMSADGKPVWINCRGNVTMKDGKPWYMVGCINEIGGRQKADNISGLLGETSLEQYIDRKVSEAGPLDGFFLRVGIDGLKGINARLGMEYGDLLLCRTAKYIQWCLRPEEQLYHMSGDEFLIVNLAGGTEKDAREQYKKIQEKIEQFIEKKNYQVVYTVSAGLLPCSDIREFEIANLLKLTEFTLNQAKKLGKNTCYTFCEEDYRKFLHRQRLMRQLRKAVKHGCEGFEAYFQPLYSTDRSRIFGAETLMRFHSEESGMVSPVEFIPILEETGLIIPAGRWILDQALQACVQFQKVLPDFHISINLSPVQIMKSCIDDEILEGIERYGLAPSQVIVELTESDLLESDQHFLQMWKRLKEKGVQLALDDFGSGYSNFRYLTEMRPDIIKIDRMFTANAMMHEFDYRQLVLFSEMVHSLNLSLCIEGTETKEELQRVSEMVPEYIQGYYFGRPCEKKAFEQLIANQEHEIEK